MKQRLIPANGNYALALAAKLAKVQLVAAYQITPSTPAVEYIADMAVNNEMPPGFQFVPVESEHSALSVLIAAAADVRTFTATSGNGLTYMNEVMRNASGFALPVVMGVVNRSPGGPINIWFDYQDAVSVADTGWIQFMTKNAQEAFDKTIIAYKVAENPLVQTPAIVNVDGFIVSHTIEPMFLPDQDVVDAYLPRYVPQRPLIGLNEKSEARTYGVMLEPNEYLQHKRNQQEQLNVYAKRAIVNEGRLFKKYFGRGYEAVTGYDTEDAEIVIVTAGSGVETVLTVMEALKSEPGLPRLGLLELGVYRPFFSEEVAYALENAQAVAVIDRALPLGTAGGPFYLEVLSALRKHLPGVSFPIISVIGGVGGTSITTENIREVYNLLANIAAGKRYRNEPYWLNVPEDPMFLTESNKTQINEKLRRRYEAEYTDNQRLDAFYRTVISSGQEVAFYGRGGQGGITAANMIAAAAITLGHRAVIIPSFGAARRGQPVKAVLKSGEGSGSLRTPLSRYDAVVILDDTLIGSGGINVTDGLKENGSILVNSSKYSLNSLRKILGIYPNQNLCIIDGKTIAERRGFSFFNMAIIGAFHKINPLIDFNNALEYYKANLPGATDNDQQKNLGILMDGYSEVVTSSKPEKTNPITGGAQP